MSTRTDALFKSGGYAQLCWLMVQKQLKLRLRYPLNTLASFAFIFLLFGIVFLGGKFASASAISNNIENLVVGYFLYITAVNAFQAHADAITQESQWGTLEQLYLSPFGFGKVMFIRVSVIVAEAFVWGFATLAFMLVLTGVSLHLRVVPILVLSGLAIASAIGLGFVFGGIALLQKQIRQLTSLSLVAFLPLVAAPVDQYPALKLLPVAQPSHLLFLSVNQGKGLLELPQFELLIAVAVVSAHLFLGYGILLWCSKRARKQGIMGQY